MKSFLIIDNSIFFAIKIHLHIILLYFILKYEYYCKIACSCCAYVFPISIHMYNKNLIKY